MQMQTNTLLRPSNLSPFRAVSDSESLLLQFAFQTVVLILRIGAAEKRI